MGATAQLWEAQALVSLHPRLALAQSSASLPAPPPCVALKKKRKQPPRQLDMAQKPPGSLGSRKPAQEEVEGRECRGSVPRERDFRREGKLACSWASSQKREPPPNAGSQGLLFGLCPLCHPSPSSEQARTCGNRTGPTISDVRLLDPRTQSEQKRWPGSSGAPGGRTQAEISAYLYLSCQGTFALAQLPG